MVAYFEQTLAVWVPLGRVGDRVRVQRLVVPGAGALCFHSNLRVRVHMLALFMQTARP